MDNAHERINLIWYAQTTHRRRQSEALAVIPSFIARSQRWPISQRARERVDRLISERASFDGVPFLGHDPAHVMEQLIPNSADARQSATEKKRYEQWQGEYRRTPYLQLLSDVRSWTTRPASLAQRKISSLLTRKQAEQSVVFKMSRTHYQK